jgi:micrococcal nuclease
MSLRILALAAVLAVPGCGGGSSATVAQVLDGDTIVVADGRHVRLVQLDAPETDENECYAQAAKRVLLRLLPPGTRVRIETDPALDKHDIHGRTLAYVKKKSTNINLELVREGAASPWFYDGDHGRYAGLLLATARRAKAHHRGLWGACPGTVLDPFHSVEALD